MIVGRTAEEDKYECKRREVLTQTWCNGKI